MDATMRPILENYKTIWKPTWDFDFVLFISGTISKFWFRKVSERILLDLTKKKWQDCSMSSMFHAEIDAQQIPFYFLLPLLFPFLFSYLLVVGASFNHRTLMYNAEILNAPKSDFKGRRTPSVGLVCLFVCCHSSERNASLVKLYASIIIVDLLVLFYFFSDLIRFKWI